MITFGCDRCGVEEEISSMEDYLEVSCADKNLCSECLKKYRKLISDLRAYRTQRIKEFYEQCNH